jgi:hypothetical protein
MAGSATNPLYYYYFYKKIYKGTRKNKHTLGIPCVLILHLYYTTG